ncbi:NYN domain-containing protein [Halorussus halobius]|uniref:NYN domain-containing protein n=1 Tax=Halorussus halobius TaxID=1710537 RepID=UPI001092109A|nr:NYN domain-containing protein [Halorussus halobius]
MQSLRSLLGDASGDDATTVALFVDGPNVLREEFDVDLDDVRRVAERQGRLTAARLYLDEHATPGLIQAGEARGFEVTVTSGDVDVKLAVDATEFALGAEVDVLAVASRDTDFKPVLEKAAHNGVRTVALAPGEHGRSDALRNAAHDAVVVGE